VDKIGLDAVIFMRFLRMLRNIFCVVTIIGCGILIPVNVVGGSPFYKQWNSVPTLLKLTPQYIFGPKFWAFVIVAYLIQATVCFFLWWNYRAVFKLRRTYFDSSEYKASLHSRSLLVSLSVHRLQNYTDPSTAHTHPRQLPHRCRYRRTNRASEADQRHPTLSCREERKGFTEVDRIARRDCSGAREALG
jgi:hypothetical protein